MISRRGLIAGLAGVLVAPAVVRASSLMPISVPRGDSLLVLPDPATLPVGRSAQINSIGPGPLHIQAQGRLIRRDMKPLAVYYIGIDELTKDFVVYREGLLPNDPSHVNKIKAAMLDRMLRT